ncbi:NAD(P)-dependent oxidoreductase [Kineococcus gynurae]|uniref:NAD(P)-dependent oxidoreductase n=1 Tax=Kineococcus gynurae TaxID=452979 RepID=A0ABV5LWB8_9ACTN
MDVMVIGASGGSGRAVVEELLGRGHRVTALARRATTALPARAGLRSVDGDATDPAVVAPLLPGHQAVVVTLGISEPAWRVRLRGAVGTADDVRSRGTAVLVDAARRAGVRRVVVQTSFGVGPTRHLLPLGARVVFALLLEPQMADTERQEAVVRGSGLDWTLVQPVYLADDEAVASGRTTPPPATSTDGAVRAMRVGRRSVARVHADLLEGGGQVHETVTVSG